MNVSPRNVKSARKVRDKGVPKLVRAVETGSPQPYTRRVPGAPVMPSSTANRVCPLKHCGHANPHNATFCARCGAELPVPATHRSRAKGLLGSLGLAVIALVSVVLLALIVASLTRFRGR